MNAFTAIRSRRGVLAVAAALACAAVPAWAQQASGPIRIGMITDRVGPAKPYAEPVAQGAVFAVKQLNANGGLLGRPVELLVEDDQGRPDVSATAARKLVDSGVAFILSVSLTPATQQAQNVTMETKTPHMTPSNSGDTLTTQINNPNFWQTGPLGSTQIATLLSYAKAKNYKRVALITDNSDLGQLTNKFFKAGLEKAGVQVAVEEVVPRGSTTAEPQMQKLRAANPDAIFMTGVLTPENALILRAYRQLGLKAPVLGNYNLSVPQTSSVAKGLLDGVVFVDAFDPDKPETKRFIEAFKKDQGTEPYNLNGYGYDGVMLVADAIKRAGSTDKEKVREAMQATKGFAGVMGAKGSSYGFPEGKRTGFDPNGMVVRVYEGDKQGKVVHVGAK
ncbi:ABC transporter substrate-binding protein [Ramlibacter sp. AW1]|uniref:ABC transporter substrate-binding protein n=1 Tax=Ramlibacter aurantiacus TaxID=2801330 RepID=A0A936ZML6_9BURK|nr:ABC transporter substrate-binding protein [Ramlibacter aurantiacus]MBL0420078.1 ABC transporter substrate-binding protein [Ramlibacter aurantiacus]